MLFDERDEQDFLDFDGDDEIDLGEQWSALQIFHECTEEYAWRETCEDGSEFGLDPDDFETEEEYAEALNDEKYGWRTTCEDGSEFGLDPEDYETEEEYNDALYEEKCAWREDRTDGAKYGLNPDDYASEDEFEEALDKARRRERAEAQRTSAASGAVEAAGGAPDLYGRLRREAAERLEAIREGFYIITDRKFKQEKIDKCRFILHSDASAARYLSVDDGFLYLQAIREHFTLPIALPGAEEEPDSDFSDIFLELAEEDPALAVKVWSWCIAVFGPHKAYMGPFPSLLYNDILDSASDYPPAFIDFAVREMADDPAFCRGVLEENPRFPAPASGYIAHALKTGNAEAAEKLFAAALRHPAAKNKALEEFIQSILYGCEQEDELEAMEAFKFHILPMIEAVEQKRIARLLPRFRERAEDHIREVESTAEKYCYTRRNAWRKHCEDGSKYGLDPLDYDSEEEYNAALHEEKYTWRDSCEDGSKYGLDPVNFEREEEYNAALHEEMYAWRKHCEDGSKYGLDPGDYESEEEYNAVLHEEKYGWRDSCVSVGRHYGLDPENYETEEAFDAALEAAKEREQKARAEKKREEVARRAAPDPLADTDMTVYTFCAVRFSNNDHLYHYLAGDLSLDVGDMVVVPVGNGGRECVAEIATVERHRRRTAPYPVDQAKRILRRYAPAEDDEQR